MKGSKVHRPYHWAKFPVNQGKKAAPMLPQAGRETYRRSDNAGRDQA